MIGIVLLNQAGHQAAAIGPVWLMLTIAALQGVVGLGGLGLVMHAAWRDRRR